MSNSMDMTLAGIKARYASGLMPAQLMKEIRDRAQSLDAHNIFIHLLSEVELAPYLERLSGMDPDSTPLWGVPFVLKDNMDLSGIATTAACEAFSYVPDSTAFVVQQLIDNGALPVGKANLDQFATGLNGTRSPWGPCRNSFDSSLISGGSSSGSAVSVAMGLASFSLGTDTAGSGRVPACFNNLVGIKPSRGMLSAGGVVPACRSLDCVSIFALHCDDANVVLDVAEGFDKADGYSRANPYYNGSHGYGRFDHGLRLGIVAREHLKFFDDTDYQAAYEKTIQTLQAAGVELVEIDYSPFDEVAKLLYEGPWVSERYVATQPLIDEDPDALFPVVRDIIAGGAAPTAAQLFKAQYRLQDLKQRCSEALETIDALLTPTAGKLFSIEQMLADPVRHNSELGYYMNFVNLLDMAAVAVPSAFTSNGLPFGVTLSAQAFTDRRLLSIANHIQSLSLLTLGTGDIAVPPLRSNRVARNDTMEIVVCGAHLEGLPLNHQLIDRSAVLMEKTQTSDDYCLYALNETPVQRPALVRNDKKGAAIEVEVWRLPCAEIGSFLQQIGAPLGLGKVLLKDGRQVSGFIAEPAALADALDVTQLGGWRAFLKQK